MEALSLLETIDDHNTQGTYYKRLLADLYLQVGLFELSEKNYQRILLITPSSADIKSHAAAQVGLANIAAAKGEFSTAEMYLQNALNSYIQIGDSEQISLIKGNFLGGVDKKAKKTGKLKE